MAKLPGSFNAEDHEDMRDFTPVPKDNYVMYVADSDYLQTKDKNGHYLKLEIKIDEGDYEGRTIWRNLNLDNPNKTAVQIANQELAELCRACGFPGGIEDSEELHGIRFTAEVDIKKARSKEETDQNIIRHYHQLEGASSPAAPKKTGEEKPKTKPKVQFDDDED